MLPAQRRASAMKSLNCPLHREQDGRDRLHEGPWRRHHPDRRLKSRREAQNCPAHISSNSWRHAALPSSLAVLWIPLPYLLGHAEALAGPRLPLDGVLLTYAAFALACLFPPVGKPRRKEPR